MFKLIEYKPIISDINDYYYQITCNDTKFIDYIYCSKKNKIKDITNLKKNLKYVVKLMKKGKIYGVGNLTINQEIFTKKIKQKIYNNIYLFITENNYKKIFPNFELSKLSKFQTGLTLSIEVDIKYNIKEKEISNKKLKLMRRNFSYQERGNYDYTVKSSNILTTSTTNINTFNNLNNCSDNDNENNINFLSSDKYIATTPPNILRSSNNNSPLSDSYLNKNKKKINQKRLIINESFKNNQNKINNYLNSNKKSNIFDLRNKINQKSSRNKNSNRFLYNKKKLHILITQESSSSKNTNTVTPSSIINSVYIEKDEDNDISSNINNLNNNETIQNMINNKSAYNQDNDNDGLDFYLRELENRRYNILNIQDKKNKKLFGQEEIYNKLISSFNFYENKKNDTKIGINKLIDKNNSLKYKEEIIFKRNREIIPIISRVKESKDIENNIINSILSFYNNDNNNKGKTILENNIAKYDKNLMAKMLKNVLQNNNNVDIYLKDEDKTKLKYICDKYNIFGSIIEDVDE